MLAILTFSSCKVDHGINFYFVPLQIVGAEFPESFKINETYQINVTYVRPDSCTSLQGLDIIKAEHSIRNVVALGSVYTNQGECTQLNQEMETSFDFMAMYSGLYTFRFLSGESENGEPQYYEIKVPAF